MDKKVDKPKENKPIVTIEKEKEKVDKVDKKLKSRIDDFDLDMQSALYVTERMNRARKQGKATDSMMMEIKEYLMVLLRDELKAITELGAKFGDFKNVMKYVNYVRAITNIDEDARFKDYLSYLEKIKKLHGEDKPNTEVNININESEEKPEEEKEVIEALNKFKDVKDV